MEWNENQKSLSPDTEGDLQNSAQARDKENGVYESTLGQAVMLQAQPLWENERDGDDGTERRQVMLQDEMSVIKWCLHDEKYFNSVTTLLPILFSKCASQPRGNKIIKTWLRPPEWPEKYKGTREGHQSHSMLACFSPLQAHKSYHSALPADHWMAHPSAVPHEKHGDMQTWATIKRLFTPIKSVQSPPHR